MFPQYRDRNMGDITSCDWTKITQPIDLLIYSTPCTSISIAGKQEGLKKGGGTASSIIWSVLNAIDVLKPKYLLMENVKALVSKKFMPDFREWYNELASRGYQNFWKVLNAKDYGVPQNRERVFMVSILDDGASYHFPEPFPLERRLKDILEDNVDEKYYLKDNVVVEPVCLNSKVDGRQPSLEHRIYSVQGIATAVTTGFMPCIAEPQVLTPKRNEYGKSVRKAYEAGEVEESRHNMTDLMPRKDGICNTITSVQKDCLLIESVSSKSVAEYLRIIAEAARKEKIEVTIDGEGNLRPHRMDKKKSGCSEFQTENESSIASTCISARPNMVYGESTSFRIRKLSEREVFRLMDVSEEDIDRIQKAGISRTQQYKMAGNSIVTNVMYHIFRKMFVDTECEGEELTLF